MQSNRVLLPNTPAVAQPPPPSMMAPHVPASPGSESVINANGMLMPPATGESVKVQELREWIVNAPKLLMAAKSGNILGYNLGGGEMVSCVLWKGQFFITGTDIVKVILFRFKERGCPIKQTKKFEEGIFSDLRMHKVGIDAVLEEPKSEFLEYLASKGCIRTQKKQKVFIWDRVGHDQLFLEAFNREYKRMETSFRNHAHFMPTAYYPHPHHQRAMMMPGAAAAYMYPHMAMPMHMVSSPIVTGPSKELDVMISGNGPVMMPPTPTAMPGYHHHHHQGIIPPPSILDDQGSLIDGISETLSIKDSVSINGMNISSDSLSQQPAIPPPPVDMDIDPMLMQPSYLEDYFS